MAHGITSSDVYGEVQTEEKAWHGLGNPIEQGLTAKEGFVKVGANWGTTLAPATATIEVPGEGTVQIPLAGHRAHIRLDNRAVLGMVTDGYKPLENMELAEMADSITGAGSGTGAYLETVGTLQGGRRVFALIRLPHTIRAVASDPLAQYICLSNGHGGFYKTNAYPTSIRVVCQNTLNWSERDLIQGISFRHTGDLEEKISMAKVTLGLAIEESKKFEEQVKALVNRGLSGDQVKGYLQVVYDDIFGPFPEILPAPVAKKRDETLAKWLQNMEDPRQTLTGIAGTAWAAFNAITQNLDHEYGRLRPVSESDARISTNLFGVNRKRKQRALDKALSLV